jgi:hypothetical protein
MGMCPADSDPRETALAAPISNCNYRPDFSSERAPHINKPSNVKKKLHDLSPRANYTDRATAASRRSDFQLLRIEGATWSA